MTDVVTVDNSGNVTISGDITAANLGSMAAQNSSDVAITGGSITGMSTPVNASDVAIKSYVDQATSGLYQKGSCRASTTANLTATYNNGSSGVGATLYVVR